MQALKNAFLAGEEGHVMTLPGVLITGAGAVVLGIGAAADSGVTAIIGGIVAAVGFLVYDVMRHTQIDYEFFRRTNPSDD